MVARTADSWGGGVIALGDSAGVIDIIFIMYVLQ